jgi:hypothetical protein
MLSFRKKSQKKRAHLINKEGGSIVGLLNLIFTALGGVCAVIGIITAVEVIPTLATELTWMFWLVLSAILVLMGIAFGRSGHE